MRFTKMQGIGNDFILVDCFHQTVSDPGQLAKRLCDRHFGVGADGLILALPTYAGDALMRIYNADGSEPEMCGNGIRCLAKFLYDTGIVPKTTMAVETLHGVLPLKLSVENGVARTVTVNMGTPNFNCEAIPVTAPSNAFTVELDGKPVRFICVSMGNPHAVTYDLYPEDDSFYRLGAMMERHPYFPQRANIEFCRVNPQGSVDVRVWERGVGETLACGTGACAVVAAGVSVGLIPRHVAVNLPGGTLDIHWADEPHLLMTGPAETVYHGEFE